MVEARRMNQSAMKIVCTKVFGRNNLIGTDFSSIKACREEHGIMFQFSISADGLGKLLDEDLSQAIEILLKNCQNDDDDASKGQQIMVETTHVFDESDFPELR